MIGRYPGSTYARGFVVSGEEEIGRPSSQLRSKSGTLQSHMQIFKLGVFPPGNLLVRVLCRDQIYLGGHGSSVHCRQDPGYQLAPGNFVSLLLSPDVAPVRKRFRAVGSNPAIPAQPFAPPTPPTHANFLESVPISYRFWSVGGIGCDERTDFFFFRDFIQRGCVIQPCHSQRHFNTLHLVGQRRGLPSAIFRLAYRTRSYKTLL